jgi:prostaglandin-endoperoxide synthase 2
LWKREGDKEIASFDTSMLFSFFAQWFTDSFLRTHLNDRKKNFSNHEIDFCQLYGMKPRHTDILRLKEGGKLKFQTIEGEVYPPFLFDPDKTTKDEWVFSDPEFEHLHERSKLEFIFQNTPIERLRHVFATGLEHGNANVGYILLNTIALREHNRICDELARANPAWADDDERLFQVARNINTVLLLKIVIGDYVKHISSIDFPFTVLPGMAEKQAWYRSNWISLEFDLLYRWHSMVPERLVINGNAYSPDDYRVNSDLLLTYGVEAMLTSASRQLAGKIGLKNTPGFFFDPMPLQNPDTGEVDNCSIQDRTVQMGRDAHLRSMNDYREAFGLARLKSFEELTDDADLQARLKDLYKDIDRVEWHVGIFAEKHAPGAMLGELMTTMVAYDAFTHALANPLLSQNVYSEATFSRKGLEIIDRHGNLRRLRQAQPDQTGRGRRLLQRAPEGPRLLRLAADRRAQGSRCVHRVARLEGILPEQAKGQCLVGLQGQSLRAHRRCSRLEGLRAVPQLGRQAQEGSRLRLGGPAARADRRHRAERLPAEPRAQQLQVAVHGDPQEAVGHAGGHLRSGLRRIRGQMDR